MRDQVLAEEVYRGQQLANYSSFLGAVRNEDPKLVRWLAASQLNMAVAEHEVILGGPAGPSPDATILPTLNPVYHAPEAPVPPDSLLHRLASDEHARLWAVIGGMLCIFYGLLPPSAQRARVCGEDEDEAWESGSGNRDWGFDEADD